jgi:hypothetical protein
VRAVQAHLAALADGEMPPAMTAEPPNLAAFVASLSSAWHAGEIRPTFSMEAKPRYLRSLQKISAHTMTSGFATPATPSVAAPRTAASPERPKLVYAPRPTPRFNMVSCLRDRRPLPTIADATTVTMALGRRRSGRSSLAVPRGVPSNLHTQFFGDSVRVSLRVKRQARMVIACGGLTQHPCSMHLIHI